MDSHTASPHHSRVRVLPHVKKLDDALGDFIVRVICPWGASRRIESEMLARPGAMNVTLKELALRMRCSQCGKKVAEVVAVRKLSPAFTLEVLRELGKSVLDPIPRLLRPHV